MNDEQRRSEQEAAVGCDQPTTRMTRALARARGTPGRIAYYVDRYAPELWLWAVLASSDGLVTRRGPVVVSDPCSFGLLRRARRHLRASLERSWEWQSVHDPEWVPDARWGEMSERAANRVRRAAARQLAEEQELHNQIVALAGEWSRYRSEVRTIGLNALASTIYEARTSFVSSDGWSRAVRVIASLPWGRELVAAIMQEMSDDLAADLRVLLESPPP